MELVYNLMFVIATQDGQERIAARVRDYTYNDGINSY